jgi:glucokinase
VALTIGVDVGGTKVAAGVVTEDGTVLARTRRPTPSASPEHVEETIAAVVTDLRREHDVEAVGIGAAGFIDADRSRVLFAPNLVWRDEPLRDDVAKRIDLPVVVENDANAAAWGEHRFGAGRGSDLVCVTVGTGIGGGIVVGGRLVRGHWGFAAEVGHIPLVPGGRPCPCGSRGCWEQYGSGSALIRSVRDRAAADPSAAAGLLALCDGTIDRADGERVTQAARAGDPLALAAFAEIGEWSGRGLAVLAAVLDPGVVVIGGGVSDAGELLLEPIRRTFRSLHPEGMGDAIAEVRVAELGNDAGLVGAADLARG